MSRIRGNQIESKIVLLGDTSVGKSTIAYTYTQNDFVHSTTPTIGAEFLMKNLKLRDKMLKLQIWDTAGQEQFRALTPMYYRRAKAALLVFDITAVESFNRVKEWVRELQQNNTSDDLSLLCCYFNRSYGSCWEQD
eukprot:TRINITY_DN1803_c0_g1_i2.p1 TRINITY_DN1803_c0_g1~~TRINITY_DN1803_c0_g1_i2.p1  ORF type:complete len:136 (+),score=24.18 TRINITY_DN1803_c0_g1_i2:98-505(+)